MIEAKDARIAELEAQSDRLYQLNIESSMELRNLRIQLEEAERKLAEQQAILLYLMDRFDNETWQCQCGHSEETSTMDSAIYLREFLKENSSAELTSLLAKAKEEGRIIGLAQSCPACHSKGYEEGRKDAVVSWTKCTDRMPEAGIPVIAFVPSFHGGGRSRRIRAQYAPPKTLELSPYAEGGEYDEATDTYYCEEGWYESNEYEEVHWAVTDTVTHWAPLQAPPNDSTDR